MPPTSILTPTAASTGYSQEIYGEVGTGGIVVDVTPVCDTSAITANDILFPTTEVANAVRSSGARSILQSVVLLDEDDQTAAVIDLFFMRANVVFGAANAAPNFTDTIARDLIGWVSLLAADFKDVGNSKLACVRNVGLVVQPTTGTSIWVAAVGAGTPTQTASGIKLRLGFEYL